MNTKYKTNVIEEGRKIDLRNVLNQAGIVVNNNNKALCPFHSDTTPSLSLWKEKNIFKCFVCDEKGDSISFWNKFYNFNDYFLAAADLCFTFNIISLDEYNNIINWRNKDISLKKSTTQYAKNNTLYTNPSYTTDYDDILKLMKEKYNTLDIASDYILDKVYSIFIDTIKSFYNETLCSKHINDLNITRKISLNDICNIGYFTFPNKNKEDFMNIFLDNLEKHNLSSSILKKVPGFYFDKKSNKFTFTNNNGLCIPIKNLDNQIIRIQIRNDNSVCKYSWFSSSFANLESDNFKWGTSTGSIATAFIPNKIEFSSVIITEGHFKAKKLCEEKKCISISVQGVSNWKSIIPVFDEIKSKYTINNIAIAFDCDLKFNNNVFNYAKLLAETFEKKNYIIHYLIWRHKLGKGIDDVINNGYINQIEEIEKNQFEKKIFLIDELLKSILNKKEVTINDKKEYFEFLENESIDKLMEYTNYLNEKNEMHPFLTQIIKR